MITLDAQRSVPREIHKKWEREREDLDSNKPIQYILGHCYFDGLRIDVNSKVLIPRPETEELVHQAARLAPRKARVIDLGTGSGCIALALKNRRPDLDVVGVDVCSGALDVARQNAATLGLDVDFVIADLHQEPHKELHADLVLSNPPYVGADEFLEPEVADYEPSIALFAPEDDILYFYRRVLHWAGKMGATQIGLECHSKYAIATAELAKDCNWQVHALKDQFGSDRWVLGTKPKTKPYL